MEYWESGCLGCEMLGLANVGDMRCLRYRMFGM